MQVQVQTQKGEVAVPVAFLEATAKLLAMLPLNGHSEMLAQFDGDAPWATIVCATEGVAGHQRPAAFIAACQREGLDGPALLAAALGTRIAPGLATKESARDQDAKSASKALDPLARETAGARNRRGKRGKVDVGAEMIEMFRSLARSVYELVNTDFPPTRWVVPGVIAEGLTLFAGKSRAGKSFALVDISGAVAMGGYALGQIKCEQAGVLYLSLEDPGVRLKRRILSMMAEVAEHPEAQWDIVYDKPVPPLDQGGLEYLEWYLQEHPATRLIVIDTLQPFRPAPSRSQTLYQQDYNAMKPLSDFAHEHRVSVVVIYHARKADSDNPLDVINASLGLVAPTDAVVVLKHRFASPEGQLYVAGKDDLQGSYNLTWSDNPVGWTWLGKAEEGGVPLSEPQTKIMRVLTAGVRLDAAEIAVRLQRSRPAVVTELAKLVAMGEVAFDKVPTTVGGTSRKVYYRREPERTLGLEDAGEAV